jgi:hypothetical protein
VANNGHGYINWRETGPRALAWLRAEAPRRSTVKGLAADCAAALGPPLRGDRLQDWLLESAGADWRAIKALIGTGNGNGNGSHAPTVAPAATSPGRSLADYIREQDRNNERAVCPVCGLSAEIRSQIADAKRSGYTQPQIIAALAGLFGVTLSPADYQRHVNRRHEQ